MTRAMMSVILSANEPGLQSLTYRPYRLHTLPSAAPLQRLVDAC
jgi:hypothetical protein